MKKILYVLTISCLLITACSKKEDYYKKVADLATTFFRTSEYDKSEYKESDIEAIDTLLSELTHNEQVLDLNEYIEKNNDTRTYDSNSYGVYTEKDNCYIKYDNLNFIYYDEDGSTAMEPYARVVCNGYATIILKDSLFPEYDSTLSNPVFNYIYLGNSTSDNELDYYYTSTYDGSYLTVRIIKDGNKINKIKYSFDYYENGKLPSSSNSNILPTIVLILVIGIIITFIILFIKRMKSNNEN